MKIIFRTIFFIMILAGSAAAQSNYAMFPDTNPPPAPWTPPSHQLPSDLRHFLEGANEFTLYSLNPYPERKRSNTLWYHAVLGQIKIEQGAERTNLVTALSDGIAEGGGGADCFDPRHGIRSRENGVTVYFLICFQCGAIEAFSNKGTNWSRWSFPVSRTPATSFNEILQKAGVPLPSN
jgi:hypothetical protein